LTGNPKPTAILKKSRPAAYSTTFNPVSTRDAHVPLYIQWLKLSDIMHETSRTKPTSDSYNQVAKASAGQTKNELTWTSTQEITPKM